MIRLYARKMQLIDKPTHTYMVTSLIEPCELNESGIEKDIRINKMKGMLYGYYIGALLSTNLESVKYLNCLKEIHNIFAAIFSSFDKQPTDYQNQRLDVLFDMLNMFSHDFQKINSIVNDTDKTKSIFNYFRTKYKIPFEDKNTYLYYLQEKNESQGNENYSIKWIKSKIENQKWEILQKQKQLQPNESELIVIDCIVSALNNEFVADDIEKRLCMEWFNDTLSDKSTNGKISTYKEELAKSITVKAKEVYESEWESCMTRSYLNDLRRHIVGEEFKYEWKNGLLSSIAAVIIAGDDWEKLLSFLQSKEMTDYKLSFAFYGILNGFANLPRDFTDLLYKQKGEYVRDVYREFYGQLFGTSLPEFEKLEHPTIEQNNPSQKKNDADKKELAVAETSKNKVKVQDNKSEKKQNINKKPLQGSLFFDELPLTGQYFYNDKNVWGHIEKLINDSRVKKQIQKDLMWFQDEIFSKPRGQRGYAYDDIDETDNKSVIEAFCRLKLGNGKNGKPKAKYFTEDLRVSISKMLKELYNIN